MVVMESGRLRLRRLDVEDCAFILELLNEPGWLRYIGDKGVHDLDGARAYLRDGPLAMYRGHGFGLYCVERRADGVPLGICGPIKRDMLEDVDIGFAFLARHVGQGYAFEAAQAVMEHARRDLGLKRIVAITLPENLRSIGLLEKIGFVFERRLRFAEDAAELCLYARDLAQASSAAIP